MEQNHYNKLWYNKIYPDIMNNVNDGATEVECETDQPFASPSILSYSVYSNVKNCNFSVWIKSNAEWCNVAMFNLKAK